ncbi:MAG TPA: sensor histidine kinase, partial [Flavobacterium sp.]|nr:sensor histidine kinase [Flavobacterium sp.]
YQKALDNFILAEKYHKLRGDEGGAAGAANNQAFIYFKHLKQYDKAIAIYNNTIVVKQNSKDDKGVGIIRNNLAELYLIKKDYKKALENINKAIRIREKIDDKYGLSVSYAILSDIYFQQKKYPKAEEYAQKAVDLAQKIGAKKEHSDALKMLSRAQSANNDITNAYQNYVNAVKIEDSLLNRENFARMAELETKYETEKKEREILQQRTKIAEKQLRIEQQNLIIFAMISIAVIAILIGFVVYNRQKLKTIRLEKEAELKEALRFIETQNKLQEQRLQISRDLHDNIGSQLTFIISSLDNLKYGFDIANDGLKEKLLGIRNFTKDTITELRDTIWAMNKEEITLQDLSTRISNFIENAKAASKGIRFEFDIDSSIPENISFSSLKGINLYRIIQESVNNALKHAQATKIAVSITATGKGYTIKIEDNGNGFNTEDAGLGNGLNNIKKRVAESGGELAVITAPGKGTAIVIHIK